MIVFILATPIASLIYNAPGAGPAVMISAVSIILLGLHQVSTGVLQGLGHTTIPMINMILAAAAKVALNWTLTAMPALGIMGAAWATAADMGVAAFINLYFIHRYIGYKPDFAHLLKTIVSAGVMAAATKFFYDLTLAEWNLEVVSLFGAVLFGCAVYLATMALIGGMEEEDMKRIPLVGSAGVKLFRRLGIFKGNA